MDIQPESLNQQLATKLLPIYMVSGDEQLICSESCKAIIAAARSQGYAEKIVFDIDKSFKWDSIIAESQNSSLFSAKRIFELRVTSASLGTQGVAFLNNYCKEVDPDILILINIGKLTKATKNTKWYKTLNTIAGIVTVWAITEQSLPRWLSARLKAENIVIDSDALLLFSSLIQGNLVAAVQEINKFKIDNIVHITTAIIEQRIVNNSRYDQFKLADACLSGNLNKSLRILQNLRFEGMAIQAIYWSLMRDIKILYIAKYNTKPINWLAFGIWSKRQVVMQANLAKFSKLDLSQLLQFCKTIENAIKGIDKSIDCWVLLTELVVNISKKVGTIDKKFFIEHKWQRQF